MTRIKNRILADARRAERIAPSTENALESLSRAQTKNGSFPSVCSNDPRFASGETRETVFPSCLMLSCLSEIDPASLPRASRATLQRIKRRLAGFIDAERSPSWSWGYFARGSDIAQKIRYPDDLDDTACALMALERSNETSLTAEALAHFAQNLIRSEEKPGGPYRTWIVDRQSNVSTDIDIVVNANIAYLLKTSDVFLEPLDAYIRQRIDSDDLSSRYYSETAATYFLTRYVAARETDKPDTRVLGHRLAEKAARTISDKGSSVLDTALALSTLIRLSQSGTIDPSAGIVRAVEAGRARLETRAETDGMWPACGMYTEEIKEDRRYLAGSRALTTAFCLEAFALFKKSRRTASRADPEKVEMLASIKERARAFASAHGMREGLDGALKRFEKSGMDEFVGLLPYRFAQTLHEKTHDAEGLTASLGCANLLGWVGYTIQDDIMDDDVGRELLPLSNICIRESLRLFEAEAPHDQGRAYARETFLLMDKTNAAEAICRAAGRAQGGDALAERAFGHALGPLIMLMRSGYAPDAPLFKAMESFFTHYLVARQLNDDAHDWEEDLKKGHVNSAAQTVLGRACQTDHGRMEAKDMRDLRKAFWSKGIDAIVRKIYYRLYSARKAAETCSAVVDGAYLESLLAPIETATRKAIAERDKAANFVAAFKTNRRAI